MMKGAVVCKESDVGYAITKGYFVADDLIQERGLPKYLFNLVLNAGKVRGSAFGDFALAALIQSLGQITQGLCGFLELHGLILHLAEIKRIVINHQYRVFLAPKLMLRAIDLMVGALTGQGFEFIKGDLQQIGDLVIFN